MVVRFVAREPGNHHTIMTVEMGAVPRQEEVVTIHNTSYVVHEVSWDVNEDKQRAIVLLRT